MGDGRRLDVVWRAKGVTGGVPKYVFEVEIGGDSNRAMAKLKHAFDLWGFPKLYLITTNEKMDEVNRILGGTFHEIKDFLRIVVVQKIDEFYQIELKESEIRKELGINGF